MGQHSYRHQRGLRRGILQRIHDSYQRTNEAGTWKCRGGCRLDGTCCHLFNSENSLCAILGHQRPLNDSHVSAQCPSRQVIPIVFCAMFTEMHAQRLNTKPRIGKQHHHLYLCSHFVSSTLITYITSMLPLKVTNDISRNSKNNTNMVITAFFKPADSSSRMTSSTTTTLSLKVHRLTTMLWSNLTE